jgi:aminoglycoside phosphotransferase (APT) family kinase protein
MDAMMADVEEVEVVVAHRERATLRVGGVFLKVDTHEERVDREIEAMGMVPVPTAEILWRQPPVLAIARVPGRALGRLETVSIASSAAWSAAGAAIRAFHDAPLPPWPGTAVDELAARLERECRWLVDHAVLPVDVVDRGRRLAETVLRPWTPSLIHGDLQICHVFIDDQDEVTGIIDWSEAAPGDAHFDLASITLAQEQHLDALLAGYGGDVDRNLIHAWWAWRSLVVIPWAAQVGIYGPPESFTETAVLLRLCGSL